VIESMQRRSEEATRDAMHALAADTGGFLVDNSNNLRAGLRQMLKDTETYYVLAYEPTNTKRDGSFRRIEVRLPGLRDVKVRTRAGYFAPDDRRASAPSGIPADEPRRADERQSGMRAAFNSLAPLTAIPVHLSADFISIDSGVTEVVVSGHVDTTTLPFVRQHERYQATVETAAAIYDETGAVAKTLETQRAAMDLTEADPQQVLKRGLSYQRAAALKPGRYRVRLAARDDAAGMAGSAWQWVQIPDLAPGRLALSSLFLLKEDETAGAPPANPAAGLTLRNAQALRRFRRDESLFVQLYAYNPKRDASGATSLVSQAEILRVGVLLGTAAPEPMSEGEPHGPPVPHTSRIKLRSFEQRRLRAAGDRDRPERERDGDAPNPVHGRLATSARPSRGCRNSSTAARNWAGWSTNVMWPLLGRTTRREPGIRAFISRDSDGSHSSWSPTVIRVGTWIDESRSPYSTEARLPSITNSPCEPHISR
jgi:hypothetical protein